MRLQVTAETTEVIEGPPGTESRRPEPKRRSSLVARESRVCRGISPLLSPLAMLVTQDLALPGFFSSIEVLGSEHLPLEGPVLLAPTHRARWDALLLPHAAGRRVSGRDCRFMVTVTEMRGLQGWFLDRLGCFPIDQGRPGTSALRYAVDLLAASQQLVVFPEGQIRRRDEAIRVHQGLGRLALLAASQGVDVRVVPVGIGYSHAPPRCRGRAALAFAPALRVEADGGRAAVRDLNQRLALAMQSAEEAARLAVGRPIASP
jgi:1-acyl-sn-glycerol-3-phosphate acyltransferase